MKERPILFTGPMVRALLEGRKTQTRRIVKPQPVPCSFGWELCGRRGAIAQWGERIKHPCMAAALCPYGQPGDRLWVKETFTVLSPNDPNTGSPIECGAGEIAFPDRDCVVAYRANSKIEFCDGDGFSGEFADHDEMPKWKPSIFMPRWASRISLEVTGVRVERLQDIMEADALAEGVDQFAEGAGFIVPGSAWTRDPIDAYRYLWNSLNEKRGYGWAANPWVWVIDFRRVMP